MVGCLDDSAWPILVHVGSEMDDRGIAGPPARRQPRPTGHSTPLVMNHSQVADFGPAHAGRPIAAARNALFVWLSLVLVPLSARAQAPSGPFRDLTFRSIGPAVMGGRIHDVAALPGDPSTVYIASATGGLWKSTNHGTTWTPIFDHQATSTFGVIAIAPSDSDVLWAGTGEQNNRQSSSWGDGVYRSTDAGATWTHVGLDSTRAIGRIVVDPRDPRV